MSWWDKTDILYAAVHSYIGPSCISDHWTHRELPPWKYKPTNNKWTDGVWHHSYSGVSMVAWHLFGTKTSATIMMVQASWWVSGVLNIDNDNDNDNETILLPWNYIISIQYTKQHTCNQYNISTCSGSKYSVYRFEKKLVTFLHDNEGRKPWLMGPTLWAEMW